MKTIKIKNLELGGGAPVVAGIIDCPIEHLRLKGFIDRGVDIFEVRADLFNRPLDTVVDYIRKVRVFVQPPFIGTARESDGNRANRGDWYLALATVVDIVDVELGMPGWRDVVDSVAKSAVIMVSEHDFKATPDVAGLREIVARAVDQGAKIVKIAVTANCANDVTRLLRFTEDCETPIVAMAMGDYGAVSRVAAPLHGSLFSYGYLRRPLVSGQPSAVKLAQAFEQYYPLA